jgi:IS30 family transposase
MLTKRYAVIYGAPCAARSKSVNAMPVARDRRGQIPDRRSISLRPESIERRINIGHWEGDTVIGAAHQHAIVTLVERKSGYAVVTKVNRKTSDQVSAAIVKRLKSLASRVKTIT